MAKTRQARRDSSRAGGCIYTLSLGTKVGPGLNLPVFVAKKICSHDVCIDIEIYCTNRFTKLVSFLLLLDDPSWKTTREMGF